MDFRIIVLDGKHVLLERIEDEGKTAWQVIISIYLSIDHRYDEWIGSMTAQQAQQYIQDFSTLSTRQFLTRSEQEKRKPVKAKVKV